MRTREFLRKVLPPGWLSYLLHLRPRAWFIVAAHMSVGFLLANGFDFTADASRQWMRYRQLRSVGVLVALTLWGVVLVPWYRHYDEVDEAYEQRGFYRALWVWAFTDLSIVLAMAPV